MTNNGYDLLGIRYAEEYGIIDYRVNKNLLTYYQNYSDDRDIRGNPLSYTMKRVVDLNTMQLVENKRLKRLKNEGWKNV